MSGLIARNIPAAEVMRLLCGILALRESKASPVGLKIHLSLNYRGGGDSPP